MALKFIADTDFKGIIGATVLSTLKGPDSVNLVEAEANAISELDPLREKFDIDGMLAKTKANRHKVLVRILVHITTYYLYNTVPDDEIPARIMENYKKELTTIRDLATGKLGSTLDPHVDTTTGEAKTAFRWGSNKKRSHDIY